MSDASLEVQASLGRIANLELKLRNAELKVTDTQAEISRELAALKAMLQTGTTGDPFRDQFIKFSGWDPAVESAYRELNDSIAGYKGEFVLLTYEKEIRMPGGIFRDDRYTGAKFYRLAVLEDDKLVPLQVKGWLSETHQSLALPVSRYIEGEVEMMVKTGKPEVVQGSLFDPRHHDRDPPAFISYMLEKSGELNRRGSSLLVRSSEPFEVQVIVGNAAVKSWLASALMDDLYKPTAHALGMLELEPTEPE
jgi:hypothetical protein